MSDKPLYSSLLFPEIQKELERNDTIVANTKGVFVAKIMKHGKHVTTWFVVLQGYDSKPYISQKKPQNLQQLKDLPKVQFTIEDKDLLKMITGGMNGMQAMQQKKLKVKGDLSLAQSVEKIFVKAGGVEKVMKFIKENSSSTKSKL
ncbi:hypothetical protein MIR68_007634 [Amoeboaphelidium protococcarum]|nr:hypothetical protein MIR68_007634 [Amoeboaphelidium protococcarum]